MNEYSTDCKLLIWKQLVCISNIPFAKPNLQLHAVGSNWKLISFDKKRRFLLTEKDSLDARQLENAFDQLERQIRRRYYCS